MSGKIKGRFDKILKKENYTKEEVEGILLSTYEGFLDGYVTNQPKAIIKAKKEVFDDIDEYILDINMGNFDGPTQIVLELKFRIQKLFQKAL